MSTQRRRRWRILPIAAAIAGLIATSAVAFAGDAKTTVAGAYTVFNTPGENGERDFAVEEHFIELVNATPAGEQIHGAMFSWTRTEVSQALADAQARGVEVHLAIDAEGNAGETNNDPNNEAINILKGANLTQLVFCRGSGGSGDQQTGCIANRDYSINHQKLFTFSATGDLTDVVWIASQNFTNSQNQLFNNSVVVHGDANLSAFMGRHFDNMLAQNKNNDYFNSDDGYYRTDDLSVTMYFSPRANSSGGTGVEARTDTIHQVLTYIGEQPGDCRLDLAHASFTNPREAVADQLVRIAKLGCQVRVAYGDMGDRVFAKLDAQSGITLKRYYDNESSNENPVTIHSKYINFSGSYNGTADRDIVFTGSQNLTGPALRNHDEVFTKVEIPTVTDGFSENFDTIWARAKCANPSTGSCP